MLKKRGNTYARTLDILKFKILKFLIGHDDKH